MTTPAAPPRRSPLLILANALRGALIGTAELLPGISGGTIALITGVYERLIGSAAAVVSAVKALLWGPGRLAGFRAEIRRVDGWLIVPLLVGMATIVLTLAGPIEGLVAAYPEESRGLFFGLVAASIAVPIGLVPRVVRSRSSRAAGLLVFLAAAAGAFLLVGLAGGGTAVEPPLWFVFVAAAIAVCALVVPGVSGSFFLLAVGLYSPTLVAVDQRDLGYISVFAAGALLGLVTIVRVMKWLLDAHRRLTLLAMAGLMLGSLRALWPWQVGESGESSATGVPVLPTEPVLAPILFAVLGAGVVVALILVERAYARRLSEAVQIPAP
ncbi:DUF368 domain-containing protein [Microbacterium limosum]|uniref:DUF368 domain-containing protein n=1 Tax=Microbacterium limosum TaxID=3079935 RepID=A0AAU0MIW1_9MICO|nr:DUF368 domain-containing protein [Microbacterium sp. Y20]WOQ70089.1 DUF368 domain-containing protein [Microbacterium sp. Y20]